MKIYIVIMLVMFANVVSADQYVNGYVRKDGSYVEGYQKSSPDGSIYTYYSTQGNTNSSASNVSLENPLKSVWDSRYYSEPSSHGFRNPGHGNR